MNNQDFGSVEDGFGGSWARCQENCGLEIVRPGKVQCDECDSKCNTCGEQLQYYTQENSPYKGIAGDLCLTCMDKRATRKEN